MSNPTADRRGEGFAFFHWHAVAWKLYGCHAYGHWGCIHYWVRCQIEGRKPC